MKGLLRPILAASVLLALTTSCRESPTNPSSETATFTAQLSPANEVPPVSNSEATGLGTATMTFDINRDSGGAISSATAAFQVNLTGFPAGTTLTMAHIHRGAININGPIVVDTGLTTGEVVLVAGNGGFAKSGIAVQPSIMQEILSTPAAFYFNVHSVLNPNGMVRGQLIRQ